MILNVLYYNASQKNISSLGWLFVRKKRRLHHSLTFPPQPLLKYLRDSVAGTWDMGCLDRLLAPSSPRLGPRLTTSQHETPETNRFRMSSIWRKHDHKLGPSYKKNTLEQYRKNMFFAVLNTILLSTMPSMSGNMPLPCF